MKKFVTRHPAAAFLLLSFGWTWLIAFAMLFTGLADDVLTPSPLFILGGIISNVSPSLAAMIVVRLSGDRAAARKLAAGFRVKSSKGWTILTLAIVPSVTALVTLVSHLMLREYRFAPAIAMIMMGLVWPLFSSLGEEFGWRGYLLPRLIRRFGLFRAALLLGLIWEAWHLPMHYMAYRAYGAYMVPAFLSIGFVNLTLSTVIMSVIYARNNGSIKLMVLYHYTITASAILLGALFSTMASPRFTVLESLISCALLAGAALILYYGNKTRLENYQ